MKIPLIVTYDRRKESIREFTFAAGAFGYEKDNEGSYLKLFWLPLRIGEGDTSISLNDDTLADEQEDASEKYTSYAGFNSEHRELYDRTLDDKCFIMANIF